MINNFNKTHPIVRQEIKKMTGSYNEDLEQEVYLKALEKQETYKEDGKFFAWIKTITQNLVKDYFKSSYFQVMKTKSDIYEEKISNEMTLSALEIQELKERQKAVLKAVDSLPKKLKRVIELYEFEELSYQEIAEELSISVGTVKSRLFNAREILNEKLSYLKGENK